MKIKKVPAFEIKNGEVVYNIGSNMASADPRAYSKLMKAGKYEEAKKMQNTPMYMVVEPNCSKRKCKHFIGVKQLDGTEQSEIVVCKAFPDGIPDEIAYGNNKHTKPLKGQGNDIVFEHK